MPSRLPIRRLFPPFISAIYSHPAHRCFSISTSSPLPVANARAQFVQELAGELDQIQVFPQFLFYINYCIVQSAGTFKSERVIVGPQGPEVAIDGHQRPLLNFCANNYLGLSAHPALIEAAKRCLDSHGAGLSSVRFICGTQVQGPGGIVS
jgi:hypothetical protein